MARRRLLQLVFPSYLIVALVPLALLLWHATSTMRRVYLDRIEMDLLGTAQLAERLIAEKLPERPSQRLDSLCTEIARSTGTRITVLLADGRVLWDSEAEPASMDIHDDRIELVSALHGKPATSVRYSRTVKDNLIYAAVPVLREGEVVGAVRASIRQSHYTRAFRPVYAEIGVGLVITVLLAGGVGYAIARKIADPIRELRDGAARFARGELRHKLPAPDLAEMGAPRRYDEPHGRAA